MPSFASFILENEQFKEVATRKAAAKAFSKKTRQNNATLRGRPGPHKLSRLSTRLLLPIRPIRCGVHQNTMTTKRLELHALMI